MATPYTIKLAEKVGAVDVPKDKRRMHKKAMPKFGGPAVILGFLVAVIYLLIVMSMEHTINLFGTEEYDTNVEVKNGEVNEINCDCPDYYNTYGVCKHSLASVLEFNKNGFQDIQNSDNIQKSSIGSNSKNANKYNSFHQIEKTLYNEELDEIDSDIDVELKNKGTIKIEPQIIYDKFTREMKIEFKIGNKRMYKLKNLAEFYTRMINKEFYKYGD